MRWGLPVLGEFAAAINPGKGSLDNPSSCDEDELFRAIRTFDDFDCRAFQFCQRGFELLACIAAIGEDMRDGREAFAGEADDTGRAIPVLNARFVHDRCQHMALRVRHDVALAALDCLCRGSNSRLQAK